MQGPAFSPVFKALAAAAVLGTGWWFAQLLSSGKIASESTAFLWFIAALALMAWTGWSVFRSVTILSETELRQTWVWDKKMDLADLAYGKLIRVRGLDWLVAPRLYVRTLLGKFAVFYVADRAMIAEFERLVAELSAFRKF